MSDNREVAHRIVVDAAKTIIKDRPGVHGSAENSFQMIGDLWTSYLNHTMAVRSTAVKIMPQDVAQMMVMLKIARAVYGDPFNEDNYVDAVGYSALAGMLSLPSNHYTAKDGAATTRPFKTDTEQMKKLEEELKVDEK